MSVTFTLLRADVVAGEPTFVHDGNHPMSVNVANTNAAHLLMLLGFDPMQLDGETTGDDLVDRTLAVDTTGDDDGVDPMTVGNFTDCGRRPGYVNERISELWALAEFAAANDLLVGWA